MRNLRNVFALLALLASISMMAQAPQKMSYQAVIRNAAGNLVANLPVGIRISILQGSVSGTAVYTETHSTTTNANGLAGIEIGGGSIVSGNFSTIDWGSGSYFIRTETDPAGGSNYSISGTSQLLSVPYALYAAKSGNSGGRTSIYLIGEITDEQALARINSEVGPNTENIYIQGTTLLTTVDFSAASSLVNLVIENNSALANVNLSGVRFSFNNFSIVSNAALTTVQLPSLENVSNTFAIKNNNALTAISIPNNTNVLGQMTISDNGSLVNLDLSGIHYGSEIIIKQNTALAAIDLSALNWVGKITIQSNLNLAQLSIQNFISGGFTLQQSKITTLALPNFTQGIFNVDANSLLTSIDLPVFSALAYGMSIRSNSNLTSISIPQFSTITDYTTGQNIQLLFSGNQLPSAKVNEILHQFLSVTPSEGKNIVLTQNPSAPPTGQGIIDKQTLISTGNTVTTN